MTHKIIQHISPPQIYSLQGDIFSLPFIPEIPGKLIKRDEDPSGFREVSDAYVSD